MTLGMLVLLQAVLGFDNLLYISLESQRAPESQQSSVRKWGYRHRGRPADCAFVFTDQDDRSISGGLVLDFLGGCRRRHI